ncbi:MAG: OmpA family protein, partial [Planctomycetota bacterium]
MADQCDPEELCEECPEWIFTLADLLMCMMGLFVILWVLKPDAASAELGEVAEVKEEIALLSTVIGIRQGFDADETELAESKATLAELQARLIRLRRGEEGPGFNNRPADGAQGTDPDVQMLREGRIGKGGLVNYAAGQTAPGELEKNNLDQIAAVIRGHRNIVIVKGHTSPDDLPERATIDDHLQLSFARASAVAEYLVSQGVEPDILRVQACGYFEPIRLR